MAEKTDLEKSHSVWSNTKLTLLCFLTTLGVSALWVGLGFNLKNGFDISSIYSIIMIVGALVTVLCVALLQQFKR